MFHRSSTKVDATALTPPGAWRIDPTHSSVTFEVRHMMIATVRGRFDQFEGVLETDQSGGVRAGGVIQAASINTGEAQRDEHLRSPDFLDAAAYPEIAFTATRIQRTAGAFVVTGDLTIRDVTRPVDLKVEGQGTGVDPRGNERVALKAEGELNRTEFGLRWNQALETGGILVGEKVKFVVDLSAIRTSVAEEAA